MTRKQLESKVAKSLRKANRHKGTKGKLEKLNELLDLLRELTKEALSQTDQASGTAEQSDVITLDLLDAYMNIGSMLKVKFQMDALFEGVTADLTRFEKTPERMTLPVFEYLLHRVYAVLDIDAEHPEAKSALQSLYAQYPDYAGNTDWEPLYTDLLRYQRPELLLEIECKMSDIFDHPDLTSLYRSYQNSSSGSPAIDQASPDSTCRLHFSQKQLETFTQFHDVLHTKAHYRIRVNTRILPEKTFTEWFHCYQRFLKAQTPQYCYGASPFTFNVWGCHKLRMPDIAKQLNRCWFRHGTLDHTSGLFILNPDQITAQIRSHLSDCGFCPALTQEKLAIGRALLPAYLNPECDPRWEYLYEEGQPVGVIPAGSEIAIALSEESSQSKELAPAIEIGVSPSIDQILRYLQSGALRELSRTVYRNLSCCLNCGTAYKPHTVTCPKCKFELWRQAINEPEATLQELKTPQMPEISPRKHHKRHLEQPSSADSRESVSFDQLWSDPEVQRILSTDQQPESEESATEASVQSTPSAQTPEQQKPAPQTQPAQTSSPSAPAEQHDFPQESLEPGRFDLHEKLRSLISKKYRERKAIENAFSSPQPPENFSNEVFTQLRPPSSDTSPAGKSSEAAERQTPAAGIPQNPIPDASMQAKEVVLRDALKKLKPRKRSELSKRGVVRVIYHATMDKESCPLCAYLDGMVMDPDDPATDIFSPPLYPGCTCSREYILKTEKPSKWPQVTFRVPPEELLKYLDKE